MARLDAEYARGLMLSARLDNKDFDAQRDAAAAAAAEYRRLETPWATAAEADARESNVKMYKRLVGDPDDPAFAARLEADLARERRRKAAARAADGESPEDLIEARRLARDAARP